MVLPDIYKPVCNSERIARKYKYRSCKVNRRVIAKVWVGPARASLFCHARCKLGDKRVTFRHFPLFPWQQTSNHVVPNLASINSNHGVSCKLSFWFQGIRNVPRGKKIDKNKPVADGLKMMSRQVLTQEGNLSKFVKHENKKMNRTGNRLLDEVIALFSSNSPYLPYSGYLKRNVNSFISFRNHKFIFTSPEDTRKIRQGSERMFAAEIFPSRGYTGGWCKFSKLVYSGTSSSQRINFTRPHSHTGT